MKPNISKVYLLVITRAAYKIGYGKFILNRACFRGYTLMDTSLCGFKGYMLQRVLNEERLLGKKQNVHCFLPKDQLYFAGEIDASDMMSDLKIMQGQHQQ